jgi:hypothetical protein
LGTDDYEISVCLSLGRLIWLELDMDGYRKFGIDTRLNIESLVYRRDNRRNRGLLSIALIRTEHVGVSYLSVHLSRLATPPLRVSHAPQGHSRSFNLRSLGRFWKQLKRFNHHCHIDNFAHIHPTSHFILIMLLENYIQLLNDKQGFPFHLKLLAIIPQTHTLHQRNHPTIYSRIA